MTGRESRIAVVGTGYVGLTTGACLAALGHHVTCSDVDRCKIGLLSRGEVPLREPDLPRLVRRGLARGRLRFTVDTRDAVDGAGVVFLCLPTPMASGGEADLAAVREVVADVRASLPGGCALVTKSTVPVGTAARLKELVGRPDVALVSNPEFLREGSAVRDFLHPDRVVVGSADRAAADRVAALYAPLHAPVVRTDAASAELVKYAANAFLAAKLSYVNAVAELCEAEGADIGAVTAALGRDPGVGRSFLRPGPGWGGSCLPKDTRALLRAAEAAGTGFPVLRAAIEANRRQQRRVVDRVAEACGGALRGHRVGLLGLAFKAGTDDLRDSPALAVAAGLAARGADVVACDPALRGDERGIGESVAFVDDAYRAAKGARALVLLTEWPQFRELDWCRVAELLEGAVVVDTRNHLDPDVLRRAGLVRRGIGC
ncbi:UDP-glucose dehydrogenase family protein [Saccharopolyspora rosea]|uniref:UDP-glucose 6-dehydrogenase n=1 Tax=Saccharopolyspora rosea TaxID=524884 RepID=A0ABW3FZ64_9PSEU|nr:UDP-glucose/GDP-mannose dehydrogenase family protein [Saccharopolyspora rosea]